MPRQRANSSVPNTYHCSLAINAGHIRGTALCLYMYNVAGLMPGKISDKDRILKTAKSAIRSCFSCPEVVTTCSRVLLPERTECVAYDNRLYLNNFNYLNIILATVGVTMGHLWDLIRTRGRDIRSVSLHRRSIPPSDRDLILSF